MKRIATKIKKEAESNRVVVVKQNASRGQEIFDRLLDGEARYQLFRKKIFDAVQIKNGLVGPPPPPAATAAVASLAR